MTVEPFGEVNAIFGGLRTIKNIAKNLGRKWDVIYACFDTNVSHRKAFSPEYKSNRKADTAFKQQMIYLQKIMNSLGFISIAFPGFEADDTIAQIVRNNPDDFKYVVSNDKDLYQLLDDKSLTLYRRSKNTYVHYIYDDFVADYGIEPKEWVRVKAIAGCPTDVVIGVDGIAETRALSFIKGTLAANHKAKIDKATELIEHNLRLVALPFNEIAMPEIPKELFHFNTKSFAKLIEHFHFNTFSIVEWELAWKNGISTYTKKPSQTL